MEIRVSQPPRRRGGRARRARPGRLDVWCQEDMAARHVGQLAGDAEAGIPHFKPDR